MEGRRNQQHSFNYKQVQEQDQDQSRNNVSGNFFNGYASHDHRGDHVHLQTSSNNGGILGPHESCNNRDQFPANRIILNPQARGPIGLRLRKSPSLLKELQLILNQEKQRERQQEQLAYQSVQKSKALNIPAVFLKIGSWKWVSKNAGDLAAKFYYKRKKLIWEFLYGSLKKKIEIQWFQISAINAFEREDKKRALEIELNEQPKYYQEINYEAGKHTKWGPSDDFTEGQAPVCRRHTVVFLPGLIDEAFKKLKQSDSRLLNLSRQPFPTQNSPLFCNTILDFSNNRSVHGSSSVSAVSNYGHQGTFLPPVQNFFETTSSFVDHSNSNLTMPDLKFSSSDEVSRRVSFEKQRIDGVWEQSGNVDQVQEISFTPIGDQQDHILPNHGEESWIPDQELELPLTDIQNLAEFTNDDTDTSWIPDQIQDSGFNNRFDFMEPSSGLPSQFSIQDFNNGGNGMNQTDNKNLHSFDPPGGNGQLSFKKLNG